jgi:hypothetical protein
MWLFYSTYVREHFFRYHLWWCRVPVYGRGLSGPVLLYLVVPQVIVLAWRDIK